MSDSKPIYLKNKHGRIVPLNPERAEELLKQSGVKATHPRGYTKASAAEIKTYEAEQKAAREAASK